VRRLCQCNCLFWRIADKQFFSGYNNEFAAMLCVNLVRVRLHPCGIPPRLLNLRLCLSNFLRVCGSSITT